MLDFDFFEDARQYIADKQTNPIKAERVKQPEAIERFEAQAPPKEKQYKLSDDLKTLTYKGCTYNIPDFYNKKMIKLRDVKTLEMIFISLGLNGVEA